MAVHSPSPTGAQLGMLEQKWAAGAVSETHPGRECPRDLEREGLNRGLKSEEARVQETLIQSQRRKTNWQRLG